jgi:hypothetical protein
LNFAGATDGQIKISSRRRRRQAKKILKFQAAAADQVICLHLQYRVVKMSNINDSSQTNDSE